MKVLEYIKNVIKNTQEQKKFLDFVEKETLPIRRKAYLEEKKKLAVEEGKKLANEENNKNDKKDFKQDFGVKWNDLPITNNEK